MINTFIVVFNTLLFIALAIIVYRALLLLSNKKVNTVIVCILYCIFMIVLPSLLTSIAFKCGASFYNYYPDFQEQGWDIKLALFAYIGMLLNYFIAIIISVIACKKLLSKNNKSIESVSIDNS